MQLGAQLRGVNKLKQFLNKAEKEHKKALETAVRVEGFKRMTQFKKEIRQGRPGGRPFAPASEISKTRKRSGKILNRLALGVRYVVTKNPFEFRFGWVGPRVSKSWKRLAQIHQVGFTREVTPEQRRYLRIVGGSLKGRYSRGGRSGGQVMGAHRNAKYFFIRPDTTHFKTPARPMRDPFFRANRRDMLLGVERGFKRKVAGFRI